MIEDEEKKECQSGEDSSDLEELRFTLPEIRRLIKDLSSLDGVDSALSDYTVLYRVARMFRNCKNCRVFGCGSYERCQYGCLMQELGLVQRHTERTEDGKMETKLVVSRDAYPFIVLLSNLANGFIDLSMYQVDASEKHKENEFAAITLEKYANALKEQEKILQEKKSKLGRPSKFEGRKTRYKELWYDVEPKPSKRSVAKILGISEGLVRRDLKMIDEEMRNSGK